MRRYLLWALVSLLSACDPDEVDSAWIDEANAEVDTVEQPLALCQASPNVRAVGSATRNQNNPNRPLQAACYGYMRFPGDNEDDCFIKFSGYAARSPINYQTTNWSAGTMSTYYGHRLAAWASPDGRDLVLQMDRRWCRDTNAEDGLRIHN